jgi:predicted MFS family arabinose efflux permease
MLVVLAVSVLTIAGTFTIYTYLGAFLAGAAGIGTRGLAPVLMGFGLASAIGTRLGGTAADRWGGRPTVMLGGSLALLAYLALSLSPMLGPDRAIPVLLPAIFLWGFSNWAVMTAQQARLVALAPDAASVSLSLNSSAIYLGGATGAAAGALVTSSGAAGQLSWVAAGFSVSALLVVLARGRTYNRKSVPGDERRSAGQR